MNIEKNKLVFGSVILIVVLFILVYAYLVLEEGNSNTDPLKETQVPALEETQKEYSSKLDALNDLKEVRQTNAPSIYDEKYMDSTGVYDPELPIKKKEWHLDSLYGNYSDRDQPHPMGATNSSNETSRNEIHELVVAPEVSAKEMGLEHQLFFSADPQPIGPGTPNDLSLILYAKVDGEQMLKSNSRIQLRLTQKALIGTSLFPANTRLYGLVSFQPNRVLIQIENIDHVPLSLKAYDLQDGLEGVYIENSFRSDVSREVVDDIVQDINLPGVPQVGGLKKVFQRNNHMVKVVVADNYQILLKS